MTKFKKLTSEASLGKLRLKNRIFMSAMGTNMAHPDGTISDESIGYYEARAKGGAAVIVPGVVSIDYPQGKAVTNQLRLDAPKYITGFQNLSEAIHRHDSKLILQIHHAGAATHTLNTEGLTPVAPSETVDQMQQPCKVLTTEEVKALVGKFVQTSVYAEKANADGVCIHAAHGYLLAQFLSPLTNRRTDEYGGNEENRKRICVEIIQGIKAACKPGFIVGVRLGGTEKIEGGFNNEESQRIAKTLEAAGADYLDISLGQCSGSFISNIVETQKYEEGNRIQYAEGIKKAVSIPVVQAGKLRDPQMCEEFLQDGKLDFVALGRALIADPEWGNKVSEGREDEIRPCLSCNDGCFGKVMNFNQIRCAINPEIGKEYRKLTAANPSTVKNVLVIGGGPGGCQAAITAAERGHKVTIVEKKGKLGGQLNLASVPPHKSVLGDYATWLENEMIRKNVNIVKNQEATLNFIKGNKPDTVLVATGSLPVTINIPGSANTKSSWDVLDQFTELPENKRIVIIGGGIVGCETAHLLATKNNKITLLEMLPTVANGLEMLNMIDLLTDFAMTGVDCKTSVKVKKIEKNGVAYVTADGEELFVEADQVIMSTGQKSNRNELVESIRKELGIPAKYIGDASAVGKILDATQNGFYSAIDL
jgi:2,4-dienoyl-CoA reductase-like NADH-dependent reductase (Old Yellow Enzyme family)/thioredoxin reductase